MAAVSGNEIKNAYRTTDEFGSPSVAFELVPDAGRRFERITGENVGRKMAIVLDDIVISAPGIQSRIRDQGVVRGAYSITEAEDLALKLRSGTIETQVNIVEERTIGPSLGRDSIRAGLISGLVGFAGVLLIVRPGTAAFDWLLVLPALAAVSAGLRDGVTRRLSPTDSSISKAPSGVSTRTTLASTTAMNNPWAGAAAGAATEPVSNRTNRTGTKRRFFTGGSFAVWGGSVAVARRQEYRMPRCSGR